MRSVMKKTAIAAAGAAAVALCIPGTASAAGPSVSAGVESGAIVVDFDLSRADVELGATCVTYILEPGTVDTADPSGRIDSQPAGSSFSVRNTSTSNALYIKDGAPATVSGRAITDGTYNVFWGCQDASGQQWENIFAADGRPFTGGITVTVGDGGTAAPAAQPAAPAAETAPSGQGAPSTKTAPPVPNDVPQGPIPESAEDVLDFAIEFLRDLIGNPS